MQPLSSANDVRRRAAGILVRAAGTHERGDIWHIDDEFDDVEAFILELGDVPTDLEVVRELISSWEDARNHDWLFHEPLKQGDFPRLARMLASDLENDRPVNPELNKHFGPSSTSAPRNGCLGAVIGLLGGAN